MLRQEKKQFLDYNSAIIHAEARGIEQNKLENAKALLDVLDDEVIAEKIRLPLDVVISLRSEYNK